MVGVVTAAELAPRLEAGEEPLFLDVANGRATEAFSSHEVKHIPLDQLSNRLEELRDQRDREIITVCPLGLRSKKAAELLEVAGFERIFNLDGGLRAWKRRRRSRPGGGDNWALRAKYDLVGRYYDLLDWPFERTTYRKWRPELLSDVRGRVLEPGVGTGHNLEFYNSTVEVTGIDLSPTMIQRARSKLDRVRCEVELREEDATKMSSVESGAYDWVFSTFMCCVMPDELQPAALAQFGRVLKPGGRFRLLEVVYSTDPTVRRWQERVAGITERLYGARFDRQTLSHIEREPMLEIAGTRVLKWGAYLLIDGVRKG